MSQALEALTRKARAKSEAAQNELSSYVETSKKAFASELESTRRNLRRGLWLMFGLLCASMITAGANFYGLTRKPIMALDQEETETLLLQSLSDFSELHETELQKQADTIENYRQVLERLITRSEKQQEQIDALSAQLQQQGEQHQQLVAQLQKALGSLNSRLNALEGR